MLFFRGSRNWPKKWARVSCTARWVTMAVSGIKVLQRLGGRILIDREKRLYRADRVGQEADAGLADLVRGPVSCPSTLMRRYAPGVC